MHGEVVDRPRAQQAFRVEEEEASCLALDVGSDDAWRAVGSPYRMRLYELIRRQGPLTITELAPLAGTNPVNLYYHVHTLKRAGLIEPAGRRAGVARRAPIIYKAPHETVTIEFDPGNDLHRERIESIHRSWQRESADSLEEGGRNSAKGKPGRFTVNLRWEFLDSGEQEEIASLFTRINAILNRDHDSAPAGDRDTTLMHIGLHLVESPGSALPAPRIEMKPRSRMIPIAEPGVPESVSRSRQPS